VSLDHFGHWPHRLAGADHDDLALRRYCWQVSGERTIRSASCYRSVKGLQQYFSLLYVDAPDLKTV
jgi:hypothetical protein